MSKTPKAPVMTGVFAIYGARGGGYRLFFRPEGETQDQHFDIPGALVAMAKMRARAFGGSGSFLDMLEPAGEQAGSGTDAA